jgi:pimeloyl-ACP methyl ester carboxylesterase
VERYEVDGVAVRHYPQRGADRPPLVLVHGGAHGSWCWENYAGQWHEAGWEVHALDWLNHGDSAPLPDGEFLARSIVDVARREITSVVSQVGRTPVLVGHSMGGLASLAYASTAPVERLVLIAPVVPACIGADPIELPVDLATPFGPVPHEVARQIFYTTLDEDAARRCQARLVGESPVAVWEATRWTVDLDPAAVTAPTLVLGAELDVLTPATAVRALAEVMRADYEQAPGIGHCDILLKEPDWRRAAECIRDWLTS